MRLVDLHPEFQQIGDGLWQLSFDCPTCGTPWRQLVKARLNGPCGPAGVWAWTAAPFSNVPPVPLDWNTVTINPSIRCEGISAHGRKKPCQAHFTVTDGVIRLH